MYGTLKEGKAKINIPKFEKISSEMPVFYNPQMASNRDIAVVFLESASKAFNVPKWRIADPMAATGIRSIRMLLECPSRVKEIEINDYSKESAKLIRLNLRLNKLNRKTKVTVNEANKFLLMNKPFSYIDIDPFGYPGKFLDTAVRRITHKGVLAVTATDTSALAGSSITAGKRKYLAKPLRNGFMHETGLRLLIRLVQLFGSVHEKALIPVFSYYKDHYIRAYFRCISSTRLVLEILEKHKELFYCGNCCSKKTKGRETKCINCGKEMEKAGPVWTGNLFDKELARLMVENCQKKKLPEETERFLKTILREAACESLLGEAAVGFYTMEELSSRHHIAQQPKMAEVIDRLEKSGHKAGPTHCTQTGIKTNAPVKDIVAAVKQKA